MEEEGSKGLERGRGSLIDVSLEDDSLIIVPLAADLRSRRLSGISQNCNEHNIFGLLEAESTQGGESMMEQVPMCQEPNKVKKVSKCNLRKSLAWDNAFFTNEGVLDPDELAVVSKPLKKIATNTLPGIQEDLRKSTDSDSTLGSESWALETLEVDLFEDIRASIQKSIHENDKDSAVPSSSSKAGQLHPEIRCYKTSQKVELASRSRMKPVSKLASISKRQSISKVEAEKNVEAFAFPRTGVARKTDQSSSLKPPKILSSINPISTAPTKRTIVSADCVKVKNNTAKVWGSQRPAAVPKKLISGDSHSTTSSALPSSKSSGFTCSAKPPPTTGFSSNSVGSTSSGSTGKSATKFLRTKTPSSNSGQSSADSNIKTPPRNLKNKAESKKSRLAAYVMSTSNCSSSISPASSLDGISSESTSSICTVSHRANSSKASLDSVSLDSFGSDAPQSPDINKHPRDLPHVGFSVSGDGRQSRDTEKALRETGPLSHPGSLAPKSSVIGNAEPRFKPSGLRMPSPKIGFFDAEKSAGLTSNGMQSQSGLHIGPLKNASVTGNLDGTLKQKSYKFQSTRSLAPKGTLKFNSINIAPPLHASVSSLKPTSTSPLQQPPTPTINLSSTPCPTEGHPNMFVKERQEKSSLRSQEHLGGSNEKKVLVSDNILNGLSRDLENVNLNMHSAEDINNPGEIILDKQFDFQGYLLKPSVSTSPIKAENKSGARAPLVVNSSFGNKNISLDPMIEATTEKAVEKMSTSPLNKTMQTLQENATSIGFCGSWDNWNHKESISE